MKFTQIVIFTLLISYILCGCGLVTDFSVDNCKNAKTGDGYCCYFESTKSTVNKACIPLTKYRYDHIDVVVKYYKTFGGDNGETEDKDLKIDCNSFNLEISLFILILLFLI